MATDNFNTIEFEFNNIKIETETRRHAQNNEHIIIN